MAYTKDKMEEFVALLEWHTPQEGLNQTSIPELVTFREVMHMPPLQYAKAIKLDRAQMLIREGKNASEAGYMVGYNSPAQFSREYKRHFGYSPSAT